MLTQEQKLKQIISQCRESCEFFIETFCKVKHPTAGEIPFKLFKYQLKSLAEFRKHRFNLFSKCRQCGVSTLVGAYALWFIMFFKNKTVLVVSKTDREAIEFLNKNVKFVYERLPEWMRKLWKTTVYNEHQLGFINGSKIQCLPAGADTLRQYSSSLNIIDEAAFMRDMDKMWSSGYPTLAHGGRCIVISTSAGIGDWYWQVLMDAKNGLNEFNVIEIDWWQMDWEIECKNPDGTVSIIAPTKNIRRCTSQEEIEKYGPYWSPWLEQQYRQLTQQGGDKKFRQEILRDFLGSGNTVLSRESILFIAETVDNNYQTLSIIEYAHPETNECFTINFADKLFIWRLPEDDHIYTIGIDVSSGEARDFSAIQVLDITRQEQVAELEIKMAPRELAVAADYLGRWYNGAFMVPERTGLGVGLCQDLATLNYPNLYRRGMLSSSDSKSVNPHSGPVGFNTSGMGKNLINKALLDNLGRDGILIRSQRLLRQLQSYIYLTPKQTGAEKSENDDLVIATGLAILGSEWAAKNTNKPLAPLKMTEALLRHPDTSKIPKTNDFHAILPMTIKANIGAQENVLLTMKKFTQSLISSSQDLSKEYNKNIQEVANNIRMIRREK